MALKKVGKKPGIYQNVLADGDIVYYYSFKHDGTKHNVKVGKKSDGINPTFAHNKRVERLNLLRLGEDPRQKKQETVTFDEVWDFYINGKAMADKTRKDRRGRYIKHMKGRFTKEVTVEGLKKFREEKKDELSPKSIDMFIAFYGTAISYWNTVKKTPKVFNPVPDLRADDKLHMDKKVRNSIRVRRERFLDMDEIKMLKAEVADKPELNLFIHLSLSTGGRLGTVMGIKKKDIKNGVVKLLNEKTGDNTYNGYIEPLTQKLLDKNWATLKLNDPVITLSKRQVQRRVQRIMDRLFNEGLDGRDVANRTVVHTLRHTFASHLVLRGTDILKVSKLLDHKDISTTMIYAHLAPDAGKDDVARLWS